MTKFNFVTIQNTKMLLLCFCYSEADTCEKKMKSTPTHLEKANLAKQDL